MPKKQFFCRRRPALTIIEIVIDIGIISLVATAILTLMAINIRSAIFAQMRVIASNLANQRIEEIRNLPYDQVATEHGAILPQGTLKDSENLTQAGFNLTVEIRAVYVDDPFDGSVPIDTAPYDYKKVTVSVYRPGHNNPLTTLTTNISSKAAETTSNTGILLTKVVDGLNNPIENAQVTVTNTAVNPNINIIAYTDNFGLIMIPKLPPSSSYTVSSTKTGYSTEVTVSPTECTNLPPSPEASPSPNIITQQVTNLTLQIRCLTDLEMTMLGTDGTPQPGQWIRIQSSRRRCLNPLITKYDSWSQTDANGKVNLSQIEHDQYTFTSDASGSVDHTPKPTLILDTTDDYDPAVCQTVHAQITVTTSPTYIIVDVVEPRHLNKNYSDNVVFIGQRLDALTDIRFVRSGQPDIVGTIGTKDATTATVSFTLNDAQNGSWDLKVTNSNGEITIKHNAIEIVSN